LKLIFGQLPTQIVKELRKFFQFVDIKLDILRDRMQMIIDGRRKKQLCDWWLAYIESESDKFLAEHGYNKDCLPDDYMNKAPKDLNDVKENLTLIQNLMVVTPNKLSDLDELIVRVTTEVYTVLDEFIVDTEYVLNTKKAGGNYGEYQKNKESLEKDMDYLLRMKSMDEEIQKRRQSGEIESSGKMEMTDVVPIGGLVMARLHVLECELRTAIEIWEQKAMPQKRPMLISSILSPAQFASFTENMAFIEND
jgi:hypothetical protein